MSPQRSDLTESAQRRDQREAAEIVGGREAKDLMSNSAFKRACAELEAKYTDAWKRGQTTLDREQVWYRMQALTDVAAALRAAWGSGTITEGIRDNRLAAESREG